MATVTMFVMNNCDRDARVLKEASSLAAAGYSVRVVAVLDKSLPSHETRAGFAIDRVSVDPIHLRVERQLLRIVRMPREWRRRRQDGQAFTAFPVREPERDAGKTRNALARWAVRFLRSCLLFFHRPLCFLDYYVRAYRLVRKAPSDVYHAHDLNTLPVAWWARRRLGGKLVYDSHEIYTETSNMRWLDRKAAAAVERFLIRRCDAVITIHDTAAEELARRYRVVAPAVVRNCPRIPPDCVRTSRLQQAVGLSNGDLVALYQGGYAGGRGLHNLVRAFSSLPANMKLVMMGWGKIEHDLRSLAQELQLLGRQVFFIPPVPQQELLHWTASADVGVIPYQAVSLNNYLCMPNKLFEYLGAGLPVVASAFPELSRVIEGASAGLTFDPEDPNSIAEAIRRVLGDSEARRQMGENARKAALVYNWGNEEKGLLSVYARVAP